MFCLCAGNPSYGSVNCWNLFFKYYQLHLPDVTSCDDSVAFIINSQLFAKIIFCEFLYV